MCAVNGKAKRERLLDITIALRAGLAAVFLAVPANAQLIDSTLDDIVDEQIDRDVEDEIADDLEGVVEQQVTDAVQEQVAGEVAESVAQQIDSAVTDTIGQAVESGVAGALEQTLEGEIGDAVSGGLETVLGAVENVAGDLDRVRDTVGGLGQGVDDAISGAGQDGQAAAEPPRADERFFAAVDPLGRATERDVWVILVPVAFAERIPEWGFTIRERRDLPALQRVLLRVAAPEDRDIAQAALDLALDAPGTLVDFNHVYRDGADEAAAVQRVPSAAAGKPSVTPVMPAPTSLAIGIVDSAIFAEHDSLRSAHVLQRDFVPFVAERPTRHGTAVASILVGAGGPLAPRLRGARLYAASVFFADPSGEPAATTSSLVAALEWLAAQGVRVVNMSLAGPPNRVLEAAIATSVALDTVVVAAVGNNGPVGEPLYPAAYDTVVGITAVDSANRIYRYANRGRQVAFAAPGVRIRVARGRGGYGTETGTSMAAPYAAAIIVQGLAAHAADPSRQVLAALRAAAVDLGDENYDDVFGFGLIAAID
jgi:subtilisin family serine protease